MARNSSSIEIGFLCCCCCYSLDISFQHLITHSKMENWNASVLAQYFQCTLLSYVGNQNGQTIGQISICKYAWPAYMWFATSENEIVIGNFRDLSIGILPTLLGNFKALCVCVEQPRLRNESSIGSIWACVCLCKYRTHLIKKMCSAIVIESMRFFAFETWFMKMCVCVCVPEMFHLHFHFFLEWKNY